MRKMILIGLLSGICLTGLKAQEILAPRQPQYIQTPLVHDPVMAKEGDTYYMFSTGWNISVMSTKDLKNWTPEKDAFAETPQWAIDKIKGYKGHTWAPDILYHNGNYHLFYSCSTFGKNTSAIGHAYRPTLASDEDVPWTDTGEVISSQEGVNDYNAIDPNVVIDGNGTPWMAFGSFWGGIKMVELSDNLDSAVGDTVYTLCDRLVPDSVGHRRGVNAVEAPFIFFNDGYYYLFVSFDYCCRGLKSTYKVMVGRSEKVTGPYLDKEGRDLAAGGGSLVVASTDDLVAVGHSAAYRFGDKCYFLAHGYSRKQEGASVLFLKEMTFDSEGWPVLQD